MKKRSGQKDINRRAMPRQGRAKQTVARIKRAMLKLVAEKGYAAATTSRVAELANVNIATLYHYYPNQHAIAHAIYDDVIFDLATLINDLFRANLDMDLRDAIRGCILKLLQFMEREKFVLLRFTDQIPGLLDSETAISLGDLGRNASRFYLQQKLPQLQVQQIDCKLYFASNITMSMIQHYLKDPHPSIGETEFADELTSLVMCYISAPPVLPLQKPTPRSRRDAGARTSC